MKRPILFLLAALLWGGTGLLHAQAEAPFLPSAADARCKQWVDSVYSGLNLQEKVGQLIVATFPAKVDKQKKKQKGTAGKWQPLFGFIRKPISGTFLNRVVFIRKLERV